MLYVFFLIISNGIQPNFCMFNDYATFNKSALHFNIGNDSIPSNPKCHFVEVYNEDSLLVSFQAYEGDDFRSYIRYDEFGRVIERGSYEQTYQPTIVAVFNAKTMDFDNIITGDSTLFDVKDGWWEEYYFSDLQRDSAVLKRFTLGVLDTTVVYR